MHLCVSIDSDAEDVKWQIVICLCVNQQIHKDRKCVSQNTVKLCGMIVVENAEQTVHACVAENCSSIQNEHSLIISQTLIHFKLTTWQLAPPEKKNHRPKKPRSLRLAKPLREKKDCKDGCGQRSMHCGPHQTCQGSCAPK